MKRKYDFSKGRPSPVVKPPPGKTRITIRLDDDTLEWFRRQVHAAGGGNYQSLINEVLRQYVSSRKEPLEDSLAARATRGASGTEGGLIRFRANRSLALDYARAILSHVPFLVACARTRRLPPVARVV